MANAQKRQCPEVSDAAPFDLDALMATVRADNAAALEKHAKDTQASLMSNMQSALGQMDRAYQKRFSQHDREFAELQRRVDALEQSGALQASQVEVLEQCHICTDLCPQSRLRPQALAACSHCSSR